MSKPHAVAVEASKRVAGCIHEDWTDRKGMGRLVFSEAELAPIITAAYEPLVDAAQEVIANAEECDERDIECARPLCIDRLRNELRKVVGL